MLTDGFLQNAPNFRTYLESLGALSATMQPVEIEIRRGIWKRPMRTDRKRLDILLDGKRIGGYTEQYLNGSITNIFYSGTLPVTISYHCITILLTEKGKMNKVLYHSRD